MTDVDKKAYIILGLVLAIIVIVFIVAFRTGQTCTDAPVEQLNPGGVDAGPGEQIINERLDGSIQEALGRLAEIERKHQEDIAAFEEKQRDEYERVRAMSPEAASVWLNDWHRVRPSEVP